MKKPGFLIWMICSVLFLVLTDCAAYPKPQITNEFPEKAFFIPDVPFFPQKDQLCGPASLQSVFAYWGTKIPQEEIASAIFIPQIKGTFNFDLVNFALSRGFRTETPAGSIEEIERQVREKHPVIAFLNLGNSLFPLGHYIVIIGYDHLNQEMIFHSGESEYERISYRSFSNQWESTDQWMLVILPPVVKNG